MLRYLATCVRRNHRTCSFPLLGVLSLVIVAACAPYATYPPVAGGRSLAAGVYPIPQVMAKSLQTAYDKTAPTLDDGSGQPDLVYALPAGIPEGVWGQVGVDSEIEGARQLDEASYADGVPFWSVEQVRVRNHRAEVDVIFPVADGFERATVILDSDPFTAFEVTFFQRWRVPGDRPRPARASQRGCRGGSRPGSEPRAAAETRPTEFIDPPRERTSIRERRGASTRPAGPHP